MEYGAVEQLVQALAPDPINTNNTYSAIVSQIDNDGTVWVNVAGGTIDTPTASKSSEVEVGDSVTVEWRANKLYIAGNATNPSAGVSRVADVEETASTALDTADTALLNAGKAQEAATRYITYIDEEHGIRVHDGSHMGDYVNVNSNGVELFKDSDSVAKFGNSARIGTEADASITITESRIIGVGAGGKEFFNFADSDVEMETNYGRVFPLVYGNLNLWPHTADDAFIYDINHNPTRISVSYRYWDSNGIASNEFYISGYSFGTAKNGQATFTVNGESYTFYVSYDGAHRFSNIRLNRQSTDAICKLFVYIRTTTSAPAPAYRIGGAVTANGGYSFAEGYKTVAGGNFSHAEGNETKATGIYSHSEGFLTKASGYGSHAQNEGTIAEGPDQTAIGRCNKPMTNVAFIIGNGTGTGDEDRSNALTVDWNGNVDIASGAKYKINGIDLAPSDLGEADYVVEQGTSGGWYYRKWDSGRLDADRVWNVGQVTLNTAEGTTHRVSADLTVPTPSMMVNGTVAVAYVGNSSNSPTFMERTASDKVRIAKVITTNVTLQNVTLTLQLVGGTWK